MFIKLDLTVSSSESDPLFRRPYLGGMSDTKKGLILSCGLKRNLLQKSWSILPVAE